MNAFFNRYPNGFRALFLIAAIIPLWLAWKSFFFMTNLGIDQNFFATSNSRLYITENILARLASDAPLETFDEYFGIKRGDLLIAVNGELVGSLADAERVLKNYQAESNLRFLVQRPSGREWFLEFDLDRTYLPTNFVSEIPPSVYVFDVPAGGASDRAGLKAGDLIYRIAGRGFNDAREADYWVRRSVAGQVVPYDVIRDAQTLTVPVTMARVQLSREVLLHQATGFLWILCGLALAMARPGLVAGRLLSCGIFLLGIAFTITASRQGFDPYFFGFIGRRQVFWFALFFGWACLIHASYFFPRERPELLQKRWYRFSQYPLAVFGLILGLLMGGNSLWLSGPLMAVGHGAIRWRHRHEVTQEFRHIDRPITWSMITVLIVFCCWILFFSDTNLSWAFLLPAVPALLLLGAYAYTAFRFRLLGLHFKRSIQYVLMAVAWVSLLAFLFTRLSLILANHELTPPNLRFSSEGLELSAEPLSPEGEVIWGRLAAMGLVLALGFVFWYGGRAGIRLIRKRFHRTPYDLSRATQELNSLMNQKISLDELAKGIVSKLAELMYLRQVGMIFFQEGRIQACLEAYDGNQDQWFSFCNREGGRLAKIMGRFKSELCIDYLESSLKGFLQDAGFKYIFPIYSKDNLVSCILVGEKRSEVAYRQEDFSFLAATASQAAAAIENAYLYEKISEQERFKRELEIARQIQLSSLPQTVPQLNGLDMAGQSVPALEVGGDYYAFFPESMSRCTVLVGDVSGKGTSAALHMSKTQGIFSTLADKGLTPGQIFCQANPVIYRELDRQSFVTAIGLALDTHNQTANFSRAGHVPLFHYRSKNKQAVMIRSKGLGLGLENAGLFANLLEEKTVPYETGDFFLLISDGISEAHDEQWQPYGEERLLPLMEGLASGSAKEILDAVLEDVRDYCGDQEQHDDQTLVVVKITPIEEPVKPRPAESCETTLPEALALPSTS